MRSAGPVLISHDRNQHKDTDTMQAAVLREPGRLESSELPEPPVPGPGEALVAVRRVGICGTDFHAYSGQQNFFAYPRVLGHELAVEVLALGPILNGSTEASGVTVGAECAVMPYLSCGQCRPCRWGLTNCCERIEVLGVTVDGGLRERMLLPTSALHARPGLSLDQLALVETLGIGMHAVERARPRSSDTALVVGTGPIGLAVAQCLAGRVAAVVVTDRSDDRLAFARRTLGVASALDGADLVRAVADEFGGELPTLVFDATGSRASMERSFGLVGAGGRLILVGHTIGVLEFDNPLFHRRELEVLASRNALRTDWATVLDLVSNGTLDPVPWISHRPTLDSVVVDLPSLVGDGQLLVKAIVDIGPARGSGVKS